MAGEGSKPVLKIPVDTQEWDAFVESFMEYQKLLEEQGPAWANSTKGIRQQKTAFDDVDKAFSDLVNKSSSGKLGKGFASITKESKETAKSWRNISRDLDKSAKTVTALARGGLGSLGGIGAGLGGVTGLLAAIAAGAYGITRETAADVAGQNRSAGGLGLEIGQEQAFETYGKNSGLDRSTLESIANAKNDVTKQTAFLNAGISATQIQNEDTPDLAFDTAKAMGQRYAEWLKTSPQFANNQAEAYGFTDVFTPDQLRLLAKRTQDGSLDREHEQYSQNWRQMGVDQQTADRLSDFDEHQRANWKQITTAWDKDVEKLTPALDRWSAAATNLITGFLDKATDTVKDLTDAGDNPTPPGTTPAKAAQDDLPGRIREGFQMAGQWLQAHGISNPFNADTAPAAQQGFTLDPNKTAHMALLEQVGRLPKGILQGVENIESSGGTNNINPNNPKVMGAFQFDEPTAARYGVNRADEYSSTVGASRLLSDLHKKYGSWDKAVAAYDGFGGLDKDIAKYGDKWREHISEFQKSGETLSYLKKLEAQGVDLSEKSAFDNPKALKTAKAADAAATNDNPQIVPFDSVDQAAVDAQQSRAPSNKDYVSESLTHRLSRAAGMVSGWFSEGGGAALRTPDAPARTSPNGTPQQFQIQLNVSAPPGSDVQVTGASLAQ